MDKELNEIYWTRETIKNRWNEQGIRKDLDEETIVRKFRRILENKLWLSKEEVEWFKVTRKGNQKHFVFNKEVDVPERMDKLFAIFEKDNIKELVSVENEKIVKTILAEILPNPYEETKYSPKEEIQKCLDFLDKMKEFSIFKETEFNVAFEMIEEMQNFMYKAKEEIKEGKNDCVRMKEYEIKEELIWKKSIIFKRVNEFFILADQKYYFYMILSEAINENCNIQKCWENTCQWGDKWLKVIERIKCIREAEKFYNIFELFEVNKEFPIIKIDEKEKNTYFERLSLDSNEELKEYEQLFARIGIDKICSDIIEEFEQKKGDKEENEVETVDNRTKCIKKCMNKMDEVQSAILEMLTKSDRDRIKEMALDELIRMEETGEDNTQELQEKIDVEKEVQEKADAEQESQVISDVEQGVQEKTDLKQELREENVMEQEVQTVGSEQKNLVDVIKNIRNMDRVGKGRMIGKYIYLKRKGREKSELCKDLEYVYAIKQKEGETILKYLPYRNFINI